MWRPPTSRSKTRRALWFSAIFLMGVRAVPQNRTIDDTYGDSVTKELPLYGANANNGQWNAQPGCTTCELQPDAQQLFDNTWHDNLWYGGSPRMYVNMTFHGTSIYVYNIVPNGATTGFPTDMEFFLDDVSDRTYSWTPNNASDYIYDVLVYQREVDNGTHVLQMTIPADAPAYSVILFDYAIYTYQTPDAPAPASSATEETQSSSSLSSSSASPSSSSPSTSSSTVSSSGTASDLSTPALDATSSIVNTPSSATSLAASSTSSSANVFVAQTQQDAKKYAPLAVIFIVVFAATVTMFFWWRRRRARQALMEMTHESFVAGTGRSMHEYGMQAVASKNMRDLGPPPSHGLVYNQLSPNRGHGIVPASNYSSRANSTTSPREDTFMLAASTDALVPPQSDHPSGSSANSDPGTANLSEDSEVMRARMEAMEAELHHLRAHQAIYEEQVLDATHGPPPSYQDY